MGNIEKLIVDGMFWLGVSGIVSSLAVAVKNALNSDTYDNTGLLDNYGNKQDKYKYCKEVL